MIMFQLHRHEDATGISGTGVVAEGVIFANGKVTLSWLTEHTSVAIYDDIATVETIHGHEGRTTVVYLGSTTERHGVPLPGGQHLDELDALEAARRQAQESTTSALTVGSQWTVRGHRARYVIYECDQVAVNALNADTGTYIYMALGAWLMCMVAVRPEAAPPAR
jgi:hypothetical protein